MRHWFPMHRLPTIVMVLAALGLLLAFAVLATNPFGLPMPERAQVSTAFATLFTVAAAIVAIAAASWFGSSDFKAQQAVKEDTTRLLATLRSIITKHVILTQNDRSRETGFDFEPERKVLNDFLCSTTAFAYYAWVGERENERDMARPGAPEPWATFFLDITGILEANQRGRLIALEADKEQGLARLRGSEGTETSRRIATPVDPQRARSGLRDGDENERGRMITSAVRLEVLLTSLKAKDVRKISDTLVDLPKAISNFENTRGLILNAVIGGNHPPEAQTESPRRTEGGKRNAGDLERSEAETEFRKFQHLRQKGIDDPNVRLFVAVLEPGPETPERIEQVRAALADGADSHITDNAVLAQYAAELADFR
jgi:hypothetical protein